jgi:hypothetical protein
MRVVRRRVRVERGTPAAGLPLVRHRRVAGVIYGVVWLLS